MKNDINFGPEQSLDKAILLEIAREKGLDIQDYEALADEAIVYIDRSEQFLAERNCIPSNNYALMAIAKLEEVIQCLRELEA